MKFLIIGIDGGTFDLIKPWTGEGRLPNLKKMMEEGSYGNMITTYPPLTGPAWVSMTTGCNPGKHAVFDYLSEDINEVRINNSLSVKVPSLWDILSGNNFKVQVLNVPMTYPPSSVNGCMITSIMSRKEDISYPDDLIKEVESEIGRKYKIGIKVAAQKGREKEHLHEIYDWHDSVYKTSRYLIDNKDWDFFMVVFTITDAVSHAYYKYMKEGGDYSKEVFKAYKTVDDTIGELLARIDDDTNVMLVSDHGFGPLKGMVNINNYLIKKGYIKFHRKSQIKSKLFSYGFTPKNLFGMMKKLGLAGLARSVSPEKRNRVLNSFIGYRDMDMKNTLAFSRGHVGQIHINKKALKENNLDYSKVQENLMDDLYELRHPVSGKKMVTGILTREELYRGPYSEMGPDIFVIFDNFKYISFPLFAADSKIVTEHIVYRSGTHRMNGMFLGYGPNFKHEGQIEDISIYDVTPTVLYVMNSSIPEHVDGRILKETLKGIEREPEYEDIKKEEIKGEEYDEKKVIKRLKDLGYLG